MTKSVGVALGGGGAKGLAHIAVLEVLDELGVDVVDCSSGGMTGSPVDRGPMDYGYQVPYAERIRREAGIATMAVGLIVHAEQAEATSDPALKSSRCTDRMLCRS